MLSPYRTARLLATLKAVDSNIMEVSVGVWYDPATVTVSPREKQIGVQSAIDAFDASDAAQQAWEADQQPERKGIRAAAANAIADNAQDVADCQAFLANATPTNAQVVAFVKSLAQQMIRSKQHETKIIKRLIQID